MQVKVEIKKLRDDARIPSRGSRLSAGADLYACLDGDSLLIQPGETILVGTGLAIAVPEGCFGGIFARSGLAVKEGLRPANCVGVVDSDYRGEVKVALHNDSDQVRMVTQGERIAQLLVMPFLEADFEEKDGLDETERGEGGFGHTGKN